MTRVPRALQWWGQDLPDSKFQWLPLSICMTPKFIEIDGVPDKSMLMVYTTLNLSNTILKIMFKIVRKIKELWRPNLSMVSIDGKN